MDLRPLRALFQKVETISGSMTRINAIVVPSEDAHHSEYCSVRDRRRAFVSGFTGSRGLAIVTEQSCALWTDGRYWLQAGKESPEWTLHREGFPGCLTQAQYLAECLAPGSKVGVDPRHMSFAGYKRLHTDLENRNIELVALKENLVDIVWEQTGTMPSDPKSNVFVLGEEFSGKSCQEKLAEIRQDIEKEKSSAMVVSGLDEIAWLFNLRGADIPHCPVFLSYAVVTPDEAFLFVDESRLDGKVFEALEGLVTLKPYEDIFDFMREHSASYFKNGPIIASRLASYALHLAMGDGPIIKKWTPIERRKTIKNETELEGMRKCHVRDAVALCQFYNNMEKRFENPSLNVEKLTEVFAADLVESYRRRQQNFVSLSFDSISSIGANGGIIHYKPVEATCDVIDDKRVYLLDSGAQYLDGTTDTTRTVHFGTPTETQKKCFTLVLKGHLALANAVFPKEITGRSLDPLARQFLWREGLDYVHGTGHGVGSFLNVHEGPPSIAHRISSDRYNIKAGMVLTNEPGYYNDEFGIRIENAMIVKETDLGNNTLCFEDITLVPIQAKMIEVSMLTEAEKSQLNAYHQRCLDIVGAELKNQELIEELEWLTTNCQPL